MEAQSSRPIYKRLFVAIDLPDYVVESFARIRRSEAKLKGLTWTAPNHLHLTVAFLGEVESERQENVAARLRKVSVSPFMLALEGVGVFPRKGPLYTELLRVPFGAGRAGPLGHAGRA